MDHTRLWRTRFDSIQDFVILHNGTNLRKRLSDAGRATAELVKRRKAIRELSRSAGDNT